jgi:anti-sigma B factor antagonist
MEFLGHLRDSVPGMKSCSGFTVDIGLRVAKHGPGTRVVTVVGQIDGPTGLELANSLIAQLAMASVVIVDLDGVQLLGSSGLSALFEANDRAAQQGRALRLVCHSRIAMCALEAAGLRECFTFADSVPDAVKNSPRRSDVVEVGVARRLYRRRSRRSLPRDSRFARRSNTKETMDNRCGEYAIYRGCT